jgi:hypothetical protein
MTGLGLTDPQMHALQAVYDLSGEADGRCEMVSPRQIALRLWPDSAAWDRRPRRRDGHFGGRGGTMPMKAGKLLWTLHSRGLVHRHEIRNLWAVTGHGMNVVHAANAVLTLPTLEQTP